MAAHLSQVCLEKFQVQIQSWGYAHQKLLMIYREAKGPCLTAFKISRWQQDHAGAGAQA
jgi:hypothetical protein